MNYPGHTGNYIQLAMLNSSQRKWDNIRPMVESTEL